jgi:hypothetical protein
VYPGFEISRAGTGKGNGGDTLRRSPALEEPEDTLLDGLGLSGTWPGDKADLRRGVTCGCQLKVDSFGKLVWIKGHDKGLSLAKDLHYLNAER